MKELKEQKPMDKPMSKETSKTTPHTVTGAVYPRSCPTNF